MNLPKVLRVFSLPMLLASMGALSGCAHYEVNNGHGSIPGYYIRSEMQEADRAVESARQAGKDKTCPAEFKAAEDARNNAYDVFRACHTEEGVALAKKATAQANALCPPRAAAVEEIIPVGEPGQLKPEPVPVVEPTPDRIKYCVYLGIEYDINKADIRPEYRDEVARVGDFMKKYPSTTAVIEGYADEVGDRAYNVQLSQRRAEGVVKYLEDNFGIAPARLSAKGYGEAKPVADNATDAGRQKNRHINAIIDCALDVKDIAPPPERLCMNLKLEFASDSPRIDPRFYDQIDAVGEYMKKYPTTTAVIEGHTDSMGSAEHNLKLSQQRAESVVHYLIEKSGIDGVRLSAKGYGATRQIAYNDTPEGRQQNRRINAIIDCVIKK
ncbi:OmpA family protein [Geomonas subterranea]|uniref:OmpA family protein n=1 Tax=Geomonas subterranea TaxID=2847989 RepID=UPI001CD5CAEC|nr:OmpA family protein [Geomonas fuzhouensis]